MSLSSAQRAARYSIARLLRKTAARITPSQTAHAVTYPGLGSHELSRSSPRALVIYAATGIDRFVRGVHASDPIFSRHTIYWESVEMVRLLNRAGYIVDYQDVWKPFHVDWGRYSLVIDNLDNLKDIPTVSGQRKVYWATNNHWLPWNAGEIQRTTWFRDRTGITVPLCRQLPSIASDEHADYLTYFGTPLQTSSFNQHPRKVLINISSCSIPKPHAKDISKARNKFLWIAGGGALHKGADLVIQAFQQVPEAELYMIANLRDEPQFYRWAGPIIAQHPNIHECGWHDLTSDVFNDIADRCIGTLYLPSACGGPGSVARVLHNGLIPITMPTGFVRAEHLGRSVSGKSAEEIVERTAAAIRELMCAPDSELRTQSESVRGFALANHTRDAFSSSFSDFLGLLS